MSIKIPNLLSWRILQLQWKFYFIESQYNVVLYEIIVFML